MKSVVDTVIGSSTTIVMCAESSAMITFGNIRCTRVTVPSIRRSDDGIVAEALDATERERDPRIGTVELDDVDVVVSVRKERLAMRGLEVVALEEAFDEDLPVRRDDRLGRPERAVRTRSEHGRDVPSVDRGRARASSCSANTRPSRS